MVYFYKSLNDGIEIGEQIVTATHNFQSKLLKVQSLLWEMIDQYSKYDRDLEIFLRAVLAEIKTLIGILTTPYKGELQIVLEDKAALKRGSGWILKYRQELERKQIKELEGDKILITICKEHFERIKTLFEEGKHLFSIDIKKCELYEVKIKLGRAEKGFKKIMQNLLRLILAYEHIFKEAEKKLND